MAGNETNKFRTPSDSDVLIGRSNDCRRHAGNQLLLHAIEHRMNEYANAPPRVDYLDEGTKKTQSNIREELLNEIKARGGRFLRKNNESKDWEEVTEKAAKLEVRNRIRHVRRIRRPFDQAPVVERNTPPTHAPLVPPKSLEALVSACPKCGMESVEPEKCPCCISRPTEPLEDWIEEVPSDETTLQGSPARELFAFTTRKGHEPQDEPVVTNAAGVDHDAPSSAGSPQSVAMAHLSPKPDDQECVPPRQDIQIDLLSLPSTLMHTPPRSCESSLSVPSSGLNLTKHDSSPSMASPSIRSGYSMLSSSNVSRLELSSMAPDEARSRRSSGVSSIAVSDVQDDLTGLSADLSIASLQENNTVSSTMNDERGRALVGTSDYTEAVRILNQNSGDPQEVALAISSLRYCYTTMGMLLQRGAEAVLLSMRKHHSASAVQVEGCYFVAENLVGLEDNRSSIASVADCVSAVVSAMSSHPSNANIQATGCLALSQISLNREQRQRMLSVAEITSVVLAAMQQHSEDTVVLEHGCFAIARLANGNSPCIEGVTAASAVLAAMTYHVSHAKIQSNGCFALCEMSADPVNCKLIGEANGISTVASAMHMHLTNRNVQESGCRTLKWLALNPDSRDVPVAISAVAMAMWNHRSSEDIQKYGCEVFAFLARENVRWQRQVRGASAVTIIEVAKLEFPNEKFHRFANDALRALGESV